MERVTLEKLRGDPGLFERLHAQARRERAALMGRLLATLAARVFARRPARAALRARPARCA